jgi:hypothetical protein
MVKIGLLLALIVSILVIATVASLLVIKPVVLPEEAPPEVPVEEIPPEAPIVEEVPEEVPTIVTCPADYCGEWVTGAGPCPGGGLNALGGEEYIERECYDYPETASTLEECEMLKGILFEICAPECGNGICFDETVTTCPADCA